MLPWNVRSSTISVSSAPGRQGATWRASRRKRQTRSTGARTSNLSSISSAIGLASAERGEGLARVDVHRHPGVLDGDGPDQVGVALEQLARAHVAGEALHLGEEARRPQDGVAALAREVGHADGAAGHGVEGVEDRKSTRL